MEIQSDLNSDVWNLIPNVQEHHKHLQQLLDHVLDQRVAMTDMKYRHIVSKLIVVIILLFTPKLMPIIIIIVILTIKKTNIKKEIKKNATFQMFFQHFFFLSFRI